MKNKKMKNILVIYNVSGIIHEMWNMWESHLTNILNQEYENYHVCVSGCKVSNNSKIKFKELQQKYPNKLSFVFTDDIHPVNVTFNKTCMIMSENNYYDGYLYVASDVNFTEYKYVITDLVNLHFGKNSGITSAVVNYDSGIVPWMGEFVFNVLLEHDHYKVPIGKSCNMHCMLFDRKFFDSFSSKIIPDIFRSYCTESVFSFLTASINKNFMIHKKNLTLLHVGHADGSSGGFQGYRGWRDLYLSKIPVEERLMTNDAKECGFGYEECGNVFMHDITKYNIDGTVKLPKKLFDFIKKNLYLSNEELNYDEIKTEVWL
jgi:hypothetical protein